MKPFFPILMFAAACGPVPSSSGGGTSPPSWIADTSAYTGGMPAPPPPAKASIVDPYREIAAKIIATAHADRGAYQKLQYLTDHIGNRISGSAQLDAAIAWAVKTLEADGHVARTEAVMVPHWVRGAEDGAIVAPINRPMKLIGLGGTVATPKGGITAPIVVVHSFDEVEAKAGELKGKIVFYDVAMPAWTEDKGSGYGEAARYRARGASTAAKHGAAAMLIRSLTARSLRTPHTGALGYDPAQPKIPAAAVSIEDAMLLARLAAEGPVTVKLSLDSKLLPDAKSANVIGEIKGREKPDEIVLIGGHLDSWDVGQGANDDGAGSVTVMQALTVLRKLGLQPRRTIRSVLFTNEENGLRGGKQYAIDHKADAGKHVLALECDSGSFAPLGFSLGGTAKGSADKLGEIASLLAPIKATRVTNNGHGGGADISTLEDLGVLTVGLDVDGRTYFDTHHTEADTLDKVDPQTLADDVAAVAVLAYIVADLPDRIDGK